MLVQGKSVQDIEAYMDEVDKNGGHKNQLEKEFEAQEGKQPEQTTENK